MCGSVGASSSRARPAGQHAERLRPVLVARLEQQLQPEAHAEERLVRRDPADDRVDEAGVAEAVHRGRGRPDARDDDRVGAIDRVRVAGDDDLGTGGGQPLLDADEVAGAVVDDRDPGTRVVHPSEPFVEATPSRRGSGSHAVAQRAGEGLERGLGEVVVVAAGAAEVERRAGRPRERFERVLDELERQAADALAAERQVDDRVRPPADVDHGGRERLVHRHRRLAEAADPGPVAERLRERRAEDERDVFDRVVLVDLEVAGRPDLDVEQAVVRERREEVVVEPDPGRDPRQARAVEVERDVDLGLAGAAADADAPRAAVGDVEGAERGRHAWISELSWRAASMSRSFS